MTNTKTNTVPVRVASDFALHYARYRELCKVANECKNTAALQYYARVLLSYFEKYGLWVEHPDNLRAWLKD